MAKDGLRTAFLADHPVGHEDHMGGNVPGKAHLVGDHQHGQPFGGQLPHDGEHLAHHLGIQGGGGLVEEQDLRLHGQGAGDGHALLLPAGQLAGLGGDVGGHADLFQIEQCALAGLLLGQAQDLFHADHAVFQHAHVFKEVEALKHHAHLGAIGALVDILSQDAAAMVQDLAGAGGLQQVDAAQQGGFARAGGADDAGDVALVHEKVDVAQHLVVAEALAQVLDFQDGFLHAHRPRMSRFCSSARLLLPG